MSDNKANFKMTMDKLLTDLRKTCHAMIDQEYVSESPMKLMREALDYLDQQHLDKAKLENSQG